MHYCTAIDSDMTLMLSLKVKNALSNVGLLSTSSTSLTWLKNSRSTTANVCLISSTIASSVLDPAPPTSAAAANSWKWRVVSTNSRTSLHLHHNERDTCYTHVCKENFVMTNSYLLNSQDIADWPFLNPQSYKCLNCLWNNELSIKINHCNEFQRDMKAKGLQSCTINTKSCLDAFHSLHAQFTVEQYFVQVSDV